MAKKKTTRSAKIESIRHKDKRANIPTEELRDFVADDEKTPKAMLYPRDPSLDPQLVWKGKDEQDRVDLAVPVVPVYIQEKIHPQAIIEDFKRQSADYADAHGSESADYADERGLEKTGSRNLRKSAQSVDQLLLFADFNGLPDDFDKRVDFYHHEGNWSNRMILGDSLLVMTSLTEKEGLKGKVQTIYFDPPYGIKFGSNWQVSTRKRDVKDGKAEDATRQPEQVRAFRDTWKLGIHSYLAYLRDRLVAARDLLTETGSIFVQMGDENVHLVRCVLDEVFGSDNFVATIPFRKKTMPFGTVFIEQMADYLLWYAKQKIAPDGKAAAKYRPLRRAANVEGEFHHCWYEMPDGSRHRMSSEQIDDHSLLPQGARVYRLKSLEPSGPMDSGMFDYNFEGRVYPHPKNGYATTLEGMDRLRLLNRLQPEGNRLTFIMYADADSSAALTSPWYDTVGADDKQYVVQTNTEVLRRCILMTTDPGDLVLDPTCGSGTTAHVAEQWGRRWITIDTSRVALALARTRLMAAKYPYYLLADSPDGIAKEAELTGKRPPPYQTEADIRKGFVYKRVPHVTLKSIANNSDIKEGMTRQQIDAAIARHAETETLYDQPYEDAKRIRVSGPFSVESLSPHRVLSTADDDMDGTVTQREAQQHHDFATMILDNLRKAGVQNTRKTERLEFDRLDPFAGTWVNAAGEFTDADGNTRRVAVSIGPEHGTVGPQQVKEAAKEAVQGVGFDVLIVCGFAFDPHVSEEVKRYGKLTVLPARMNPDLAMGDELLKKTGAGNLFMVFGEPDLDVKKQKDGRLVATLNGVDVYDPTTGQIRGSSTDDVACWFIDTDYNGESFFVRHAYFTGADEPYQKLKRALRAEIDEAAWSALYSTISRPFDRPPGGKIAAKVINHYGDEVLKVFDV
ncbi:MAG: site-specific DNA-methyltransferase [Phycisphaerae bacterium]|nr:site-specific DNA-methyltransferase [Phycisphaerae bacterium]